MHFAAMALHARSNHEICIDGIDCHKKPKAYFDPQAGIKKMLMRSVHKKQYYFSDDECKEKTKTLHLKITSMNGRFLSINEMTFWQKKAEKR